MIAPRQPDKTSALFQSRKRHCNTVQEALDGAIAHLESGRIQEQIADVFAGGFGPEPTVTFQISIRKDVATPGSFVYQAQTKMTHEIGSPVRLHGLQP